MSNRRSVWNLAAAMGIVLVFVGGCGAPRHLEAVRASGNRNMERQQYDAALVDFQEYVQRAPADARGNFDLGTALVKVGRVRESLPHFWVAYDLNPMQPEFVEGLAEALFLAAEQATVDVGERADLYRFLNDRTRQFPTVDEFLRLGRYARRLGDADEALTALLTAARIDAGRTVAPQLALADFYEAAGDTDAAILRLRMALFLDPRNPEIASRLRALGEIPGPTLALPPTEAP